jgi:twitching motility protein PilT
VILLGELRDRETIETALQAAETGHLVLSTMHTIDAAETISRAVSVFPPYDQVAIRKLFASVLRWIVSQRLILKADGKSRIAACEVLRNFPRMAELITEEAGPRAICELLEKNSTVYGTQSFDQCLMKWYREKVITLEQAMSYCSNPSDFKQKVEYE